LPTLPRAERHEHKPVAWFHVSNEYVICVCVCVCTGVCVNAGKLFAIT